MRLNRYSHIPDICGDGSLSISIEARKKRIKNNHRREFILWMMIIFVKFPFHASSGEDLHHSW